MSEPIKLHPQAQAMLDEVNRRPPQVRTVAESRHRLDALAERVGAGPVLRAVTDLEILGPGGPIRCRLYDDLPEATAAVGTIIYLHGGGWVAGDCDHFDAFCRYLALASRCRVLSVGYRLAPEHPFPAAVQDAYAATLWACQQEPQRRVALMGDSAGGNLAAVCAVLARDAALPNLACQVLAYPILGRDYETESHRIYGLDGMLRTSDVQWYWDQYAGSSASADFRTTPLLSDVSGVAPALIIVAEHDPLRDDGLDYAERLSAAGVHTELLRYEDMPHGFFTMVTLLDSSVSVVNRVAGMVARQLETGGIHDHRTGTVRA